MIETNVNNIFLYGDVLPSPRITKTAVATSQYSGKANRSEIERNKIWNQQIRFSIILPNLNLQTVTYVKL